MPQKSTYFYPKLMSGLIVNKIDPEDQSDGRRHSTSRLFPVVVSRELAA